MNEFNVGDFVTVFPFAETFNIVYYDPVTLMYTLFEVEGTQICYGGRMLKLTENELVNKATVSEEIERGDIYGYSNNE